MLWAARKNPGGAARLPLLPHARLHRRPQRGDLMRPALVSWSISIAGRSISIRLVGARKRVVRGFRACASSHGFSKGRQLRSNSAFVLSYHGEAIKQIKHGFASARRAGLEGVTPHTLRHTCGTWLAQRGGCRSGKSRARSVTRTCGRCRVITRITWPRRARRWTVRGGHKPGYPVERATLDRGRGKTCFAGDSGPTSMVRSRRGSEMIQALRPGSRAAAVRHR